MVRGYVAGDIDLDGDIFDLLELAFDGLRPRVAPAGIAKLVRATGRDGLEPLPPPPEEARVSGRRRSARRDAGAIAHHYDVSNESYEHVGRAHMPEYNRVIFDDLAPSTTASVGAR